MQRGQFNQQQQNKDTVSKPNVVNAKQVFGSKKYPSSGTICNYVFGKFSRAYG